MDTLDRKVEPAYASEPLLAAPHANPSSRGRTLSRRTKVLLISLTTIASVGFHIAKDIFYAPHASHADPPSQSSGELDWYALEPSTEIKWTPCYDGHQCARLLLPLDYLSTDPAGPTTAIALRMVPARNRTSYRGTVLVNPGGPGGAGTQMVARAGANISAIVGDSFDVLGFDPRGTGSSTPRLECFESTSQRDIWQAQDGVSFLNASDEAVLGLTRARQRVVGERCGERVGGEEGIARFMSTASVATDMLKITEKLGQEKLHYWGFSYGSVLGQYFAAMYPDKVARLIIDGVYDAHNYRAALWNSNLVDNEAVMDSLFTYCHQAGPLKCTLYESTPALIRERYDRVLAAVAREPVTISLAEPPAVVTHEALVQQLFRAAYKPLAQYGTVIDTIIALETRNQTALVALAEKLLSAPKCECASSASPWLGENDAFSAIACGDGDVRAYDKEAYRSYYETLVADAPRAGPIWAVHYLQCTEWPVRPTWRYTGPLEAHNTSHPLLIVQPRWDPVCPLRDALAVRARYAGAGLVVQESHGHCSLSTPSLCTARHVRAYMEDGTLPKEGTVCEADEIPFVGEVRGQDELRALSVEDRRLLDAMRGLSDVVPMFGAM